VSSVTHTDTPSTYMHKCHVPTNRLSPLLTLTLCTVCTVCDLFVCGSPKYCWLGCSDARVSPNDIMGEQAGSVFIWWNVANLVCNTDINFMSAVQYAVGVLEVPHIIVYGHYDCGGVRAGVC